MVMDEDNFGYTLTIKQPSNSELQADKKRYMKNTLIDLAEAAVVPFLAQLLYQVIDEPYNSYAYCFYMTVEAITIGSVLHSGYNWWGTSRELGRLEKIVGKS